MGGWRGGSGCSHAVEDGGVIENELGLDGAFHGVWPHSDLGKRHRPE